ncbi:hypothetical protein [Anaerosolibacter sp.]|uniref:hypothetical protein n=1 Tax=Anaerosolibacter sp. TaxID=1872527 RepID=UPI0039EE5E85
MTDYGVTPQGFRKKRLDIIKQEIESDLADLLGVPINTAPDSVFSQLIAPFSDELAALWDVAEKEYYAMYPASAEGNGLDNAVSFTGVRRKIDTKTKVEETCIAINGTIIPGGSKIRRTSGAVEYYTSKENGKVISSAARRANVKVLTLAANTDYFVTLDGLVYNYKSGSSPSEADVLLGIKNAINSIDWVTSINESILIIDRADKSGGHTINISSNLTFDSVGSNIAFYSDEYGPFNPPIGSVNEIVTPIDGWISCINEIAAVVGQVTENDSELRQGYSRRVALLGRSVVESIEANILQNVSGVSDCKAYENDTNVVDSEGRPAHSIECIVEGGDNQEIAVQIFSQKTGGAALFGDVSQYVTDSKGVEHEIRFNRPTEKNVWLSITASATPGKSLPSDAVNIITSTVVNEGNKLLTGDDVIPQQFYGPVYAAVANLGVLTVKAVVSETAPLPGDYSESPINLTSREKGRFDPSRVEVTIL